MSEYSERTARQGVSAPWSTIAHLGLMLDSAPPDLGVIISGKSADKSAPQHWGRLVPFLVTRERVSDAVELVANLPTTTHCYVSVGLMGPSTWARLTSQGGRGSGSDVVALTMLGADLDVETPGRHEGSDLPYPPDIDAAASILQPWPTPTMVLNTGGGLQAWWRLSEPLMMDTPEGHRAGESLTAAWVAMLQHHARAELGWKVDNTGDLARVLRVAGSHNPKRTPPDPVTIYNYPGAMPPEMGDEEPWVAAELAGALAPWEHRWELPTHDWRELANLAAEHAPPPPQPKVHAVRRSGSAPAQRDTEGTGPQVAQAIDRLPWSLVLPSDWSLVDAGAEGLPSTVKGEPVEYWLRPGAESTHSMVCWVNGGAHLHSSGVPSLSPGSYSRAELYAWAHGFTPDTAGVAAVARDVARQARQRLQERYLDELESTSKSGGAA